MTRAVILILFFLCYVFATSAQNVTVRAVDKPAAEVFRSIMEQTAMNFVYSSDLLKDVRVTVDARHKPLRQTLDDIFRDTDITYKIKKKNVILLRKKPPRQKKSTSFKMERSSVTDINPADSIVMLSEIVVESRKESAAIDSPMIGVSSMTGEEISRMPALLGESDVVKSLHYQAGITESTAGIAGMNVHGGDEDENMFMLDNVPVYQVNHLAGLFSAFNTDIINRVDFYKTSIPSRFDGRLSSFTDIRLKNGNTEGHHGSARLGLTSAAFNISGPIGRKTTYLVGIRRSWIDLQFLPLKAIINSHDDTKLRFQYYFMDLNAKVNHSFSTKLNGFINTYLGSDLLHTGSWDTEELNNGIITDNSYKMNWGNFLVQAGIEWNMDPRLKGNFSIAYLRSFSGLKIDERSKELNNGVITGEDRYWNKYRNNIDDVILRADFTWNRNEDMALGFGANYTRHLFRPDNSIEEYFLNSNSISNIDSVSSIGADDINLYIETDRRLSDRFRVNCGLNASLFRTEGKTRGGISPRLQLNYAAGEGLSFQAAYTRTVQYIHRLSTSYLSLPSDRWIPVTGKFKPMTADKIAVGGRWTPESGGYAVSLEAYWKFMHNLIDYRDAYYLVPPSVKGNDRLTSGKGTAKGVDITVEKTSGKLTGHISYSLAWADRRFAEKNDGMPFPARFDHRHTVNILLNWNISRKVSLNAAWTGHSGNRFTFMPQRFETPDFGLYYINDGEPLGTKVNNYQLPFYHRLDLSCTVRNRRGYWTFGLYNAYCNINTVAIVAEYKNYVEYAPDGSVESAGLKPVFKKYGLLPIIPSISYTWQF